MGVCVCVGVSGTVSGSRCLRRFAGKGWVDGWFVGNLAASFLFSHVMLRMGVGRVVGVSETLLGVCLCGLCLVALVIGRTLGSGSQLCIMYRVNRVASGLPVCVF